jgi:hypothetical protein
MAALRLEVAACDAELLRGDVSDDEEEDEASGDDEKEDAEEEEINRDHDVGWRPSDSGGDCRICDATLVAGRPRAREPFNVQSAVGQERGAATAANLPHGVGLRRSASGAASHGEDSGESSGGQMVTLGGSGGGSSQDDGPQLISGVGRLAGRLAAAPGVDRSGVPSIPAVPGLQHPPGPAIDATAAAATDSGAGLDEAASKVASGGGVGMPSVAPLPSVTDEWFGSGDRAGGRRRVGSACADAGGNDDGGGSDDEAEESEEEELGLSARERLVAALQLGSGRAAAARWLAAGAASGAVASRNEV